MEFRILGPLEVVDGDRLVPLPRLKHRALLAVLLLHAGEVLSTDRLIDDLWGGQSPPTARAALQNYVAMLRKALGRDLIVKRPAGYLLDVAAEQIDLGTFSRLVKEARAASDNAERAVKLREALALWRGPPLADLAFEPFAALGLTLLADLRQSVYHDLIEAELALGAHARLVNEIEALVVQYPYDELVRGQLILALYRSGRQADALAAFQVARSALVDDLAIEPGPALRALQQQILNQDPELDLPSRPRLSIPPVRKTVTVLFAGASLPADVLDPEVLHSLQERFFISVKAVIARHGGTVERVSGDAAMAVFGVPAVHEDDALRALRAAVDAREVLRSSGEDLGLRIGVTTGEVYAEGSDGDELRVTGAPVNVSRWLEQTASPGEILIGAPTLRLVRSAVKAEPLDAPGPETVQLVPPFRLVSIAEDAPAIERHLDRPLVGRDAELGRLRAAFAEVRRERRCRLVTVVGDAGIGKTRLVSELVAEVRADATVLVGRCVSSGGGASYLPLAEMIAQAGDDLTTVLGSVGSTGEELLAVRGYFEARAKARPLVLVFEDIHWAEPTLLDLLEYLEDNVAGVPLLTLCLSRPELLEGRPGWRVGLTLAPLEVEGVRAMLHALAGPLEPAIVTRIVEIAEGNPLYAEQLLTFATEVGTLDGVPLSLEALLASRLDRLGAGERHVLQRAALVGREFSREAVAELCVLGVAATVDEALGTLQRAGIVEAVSGDGFRFHHVLMRDVAYASLPKAERADLHERLADSLERTPRGSDELVGYHFEQAALLGTELDPAGGRAGRLAAAAGARLGAAGLRAWKRGDTSAAVNLLGRAAGLLPARDPFRLELLCELGVALRGAGELRHAEAVLVEGAETAGAAAERRFELRARLELANVRLFSEPGGSADELFDVANEGIPVFEAVADDHALARAWRLIAYVDGAVRCRYGRSAEAAERALGHERRTGWSTAAILGDLAAALYYGPTPVARAIGRCRALLKDADLGGEANVLRFVAGLEAMRGRFDEARRLIEQAEGLYAELGQAVFGRSTCQSVRGRIELLAGDTVAAEQALRASYAALETMGDRGHIATRAAELAEVVYANGRREEADDLCVLAEELGASDDLPTQLLWRGARARLLVASGEPAKAEALAREAAQLAETTDMLNGRAHAALEHAELLYLRGRVAEAVATGELAVSLFEEKGNVVAAARGRARLDGFAV